MPSLYDSFLFHIPFGVLVVCALVPALLCHPCLASGAFHAPCRCLFPFLILGVFYSVFFGLLYLYMWYWSWLAFSPCACVLEPLLAVAIADSLRGLCLYRVSLGGLVYNGFLSCHFVVLGLFDDCSILHHLWCLWHQCVFALGSSFLAFFWL